MSNITINTRGFVELANKLNTDMSKVLDRAIFKVGNFMENEAKKNINESVYSSTPSEFYKRTGKARQSIILQKQGTGKVRVYMGVNYGRYLEEGTGIYANNKPFFTTFGGKLDKPIKYKGMKKRPFWQKSVEATQSQAQTIIDNEVKKALN